MELIRTHKALFATLALTVLYALHYGIPLYATSSYLKSVGFSTAGVSLLYGCGAFLTLLSSNHIAKYVKRYHTYSFTFAVVFAEMAVTIAFAFTKHTWLLALFFVVHFILTIILFVLLNIFVESFTPVRQTGLVRGVFLTLLNTGILVSPLIGGLLLAKNEVRGTTGSEYSSLYLIASIILLPFFFFLHHYLREVKEPAYENHSLYEAALKAVKNHNLRAAISSQFALQAFYIVMVIYTPVYVTSLLGISIATYLTVIAPISLLPLVILPYELGYLADAKYGEKEFLVAGLSLLGVTSFFLGTLETTSMVFVIILLFFSRVGAALVETMSYTYYYKKIARDDPSMTSLFTNISTFAACVVPLFLFLISPLVMLHEGIIFILLGVLAFSTIHSALTMKDTK